MTLTWQPIDNDGNSAGNPFVLASGYRRGAGTKVVLAHTITHQRLTESVNYPRAEEAEHFDRGNQSTVVNVLVAHEFSSFRDCAKYCADLGSNLTGRGNLVIDYAGGGRNTLPNAVWQAIPTPEKLGVSVVIPFTFLGGKMI